MRVRVRRHREVALADRLADPRPRLTPQVLELPLIDPYEGLGYSDVVRSPPRAGSSHSAASCSARHVAAKRNRKASSSRQKIFPQSSLFARCEESRGVGGAESATLDWREGNAVLEVHMVCSQGCPSDVLVALRRWATDVDRVARGGR